MTDTTAMVTLFSILVFVFVVLIALTAFKLMSLAISVLMKRRR